MKRTLLLLLLIFPAVILEGAGPVFVERIEFRGVRNIDRYEVVRNANGKASGKGIIIDTGYLKETLDKNVMIKNYTIDVENGMLIITVDEKYPLFMVLMTDKNISAPCLVDENGDIVESGRFIKTDMPIIVIDKGFYGESKNSRLIIELFSVLKQIRSTNGDLADELSEVEVLPDGDLRVGLKKRKTNFFVKNEFKSFKKIEKSAAYLDAVNVYPAALDLKEKRILIRE